MCNCYGQPTRLKGTPPVPVVGERGLLLMQSDNGRGALYGPITGTWYPFDERAKLWVDRRDAIYFLAPDLRLA
jgi:hypothetical protein